MGSILKIRDENGNFIDIPAIKGDEGKNAYEHALEGGFIGTEEEFNKAIAELSPSVTPEMIGAANREHTHSVVDFITGVLGVVRGGTGTTSYSSLRNLLGLGNNTGALKIENGGTGASDRKTAFANLAYLGEDVISSADDTTTNWVALGTGYAYFKTKDLLASQPSTWGIVVNVVKGGDVFQIWYTIGATALMCKRAGSTSNGWYSSWTKTLDENNVSDFKIPKMTTGYYVAASGDNYNEESKTKTIDCGIVPRFVLFYGYKLSDGGCGYIGYWNTVTGTRVVFLGNSSGQCSTYTATLSGTSLTLTSPNQQPWFNLYGNTYDWVAWS